MEKSSLNKYTLNHIKKASVIVLLSIISISSAIAGNNTFDYKRLQDTLHEEQEEIIIEKNGTTEKVIIEIEEDKVTVNGQEIERYESPDKKIIIKRRKKRDHQRRFHQYDAPYDHYEQEFNWHSPHHPKKKLRIKPSHPNKGFLGIYMDGNSDPKGVRVTEVIENSPANKHGILKDDIITKIEDKNIENIQDIASIIGNHSKGDTVSISLIREDKKVSIDVILSSRHAMKRNFHEDNEHNREKKYYFKSTPFWDDLEGHIKKAFKYPNRPKVGIRMQDVPNKAGVKILNIVENSPASKSDLKEGDMITKANQKEIKNIEDFRDVLESLYNNNGDKIDIKYTRKNKVETTIIDIEPILEEEEF